MAKAQTKAVALKTVGGVPAWAQNMEADAGKGVSTRAEDNLIPMMRILQSLSPQVLKQKAEYIKGAEAGNIFVRGLPEPVINGDEGVFFQPCHFTKKWVEWIPRDQGGGIVERYDEKLEEAELYEDPKTGRKTWMLPNGHELVETRYHTGILHFGDERMSVVIPLSSTGHSFSKAWMLAMNMKKTPGGRKAPAWAFLYQLITVPQSNAKGDWFTFSFKDAGMVPSEEDYEAGKSLFAAVDTGAKQFDEHRDEATESNI